MSNDNVDMIRRAYEAYARGDVDTVLNVALERRTERGLVSELEEVVGNGERVMVVARTPGVDACRVTPADDRNFTVFTVREGRIVAIGDCRDRAEALALAGIL